MSYTPREHIETCQTLVLRAKIVAKHYPDAYREKRGDEWQWCHDTAINNATGFTVEVREERGEQRAVFCPYHEIEEGDVKARVYAAGWGSHVGEWDLLRRIEARADLHAAILALLKVPA